MALSPARRKSYRDGMRLLLWHRLFIALAALSGAALLGFSAWQQHSFGRSFLSYLDTVTAQRLAPANVRLAAAYAEHGSWDFLRDKPRQFGELVEPPPRGPFDDEHEHRERLDPPPPGAGLRDDRGPMPGHLPPRPHGPPDLMPRLTLLDAGNVVIVGNPNPVKDATAIAIELGDRRIGTLSLAPAPQISDAADQAFAQAQLRSAIVAGIAVLVGALLLALVVARGLLAPVRALARGTRALADGDYTQRIAVARSDELGALARDFNHLAASLEQHREARREWGADIAHELRTPLSILRGEIQAMQDGVRPLARASLDSLQAECGRLGKLIDDLYQLALADAGALEYRFETLDACELIRDIVESRRKNFADAGLHIEETLALHAFVRGDERRLSQLVDNLLTNARRYTDAPGRIHVEVARSATDVRVIVEDSPPGVPAEALPRLFDRLFRVETSRTRSAGGAGLGLAICRAIVIAHGGSIEATPSPLGGLRIVVRLPASESVGA